MQHMHRAPRRFTASTRINIRKMDDAQAKQDDTVANDQQQDDDVWHFTVPES